MPALTNPDLMDIIAMALYGVSDSDHFSLGSKVGEDFDISGYEYGSEFDTEYGYITPNPMVRYDDSDMSYLRYRRAGNLC